MTKRQQGQEQPVKPHHTDVYFVHSAFTFPAFFDHGLFSKERKKRMQIVWLF
jgi:hypothetical protein